MAVIECVEIVLNEQISFRTAQSAIAKIQAAIKNGITHIHLAATESTKISSAGFLAFLAVAARHLEDKGGELQIVGANANMKNLLAISRLERLAR
jgi:anti-anti-sigma regulatory factor